MAKQTRSDDTRSAVLDVVCQHLWRDDEGLVRIADVCSETGLSSSVIYNHFRSRQGLIDAAYLEIYREVTAELLAIFKDVMTNAASANEIISNLRTEIAGPLRHAHWELRRHLRIRIATAAIARPSMRTEFAELQDTYLRGIAHYFEDLQERHVVGNLLAPRQQAIMFESCLVLRSFADIAVDPVDDDNWLSMLATVLGTWAD